MWKLKSLEFKSRFLVYHHHYCYFSCQVVYHHLFCYFSCQVITISLSPLIRLTDYKCGKMESLEFESWLLVTNVNETYQVRCNDTITFFFLLIMILVRNFHRHLAVTNLCRETCGTHKVGSPSLLPTKIFPCMQARNRASNHIFKEHKSCTTRPIPLLWYTNSIYCQVVCQDGSLYH